MSANQTDNKQLRMLIYRARAIKVAPEVFRCFLSNRWEF